MRQISLDGCLGKDAELGITKGGKQYVKFSLANNTFCGGEKKTDWFDVTSYDPYVINNRLKFLTKGKYVIVHGGLTIDTNVKNGKIWLNQSVTANLIDSPSFMVKKEDSEQAISTGIIGNTKDNEKQNVAVATVSSENDDLPF